MRHNPFTNHVLKSLLAAGALAAVVVAPVLSAGSASGATATAKAGAKCTTVGAKSGTLVCTTRSGKRVWAKAVSPTTVAGASAATTVAAVATSSAASTSTGGIEGTWKPTSASEVGYRVKEVLNGQSAEGVGRTNSVTGSLTIAGTKATAADLVIDVTTLKSDQGRRDNQVQTRILDTSAHPTATLKLTSPVDFGKVPADKEVITAKAKADLTLRGTTKSVEISLNARRNGANIEVQGTIPLVFADYSIPNPSVAGIVSTEDHGLLEFLVVFSK